MISGKTLVEKSAADANDTETLNHLQTKVENLIETIRHVGIIVSDFQTESQDILYEKVDQIVDHLREIDDFKSLLNIQVPAQILDYIDQGRNPDLYMRDCLQETLSLKETTLGKVEAYKAFHSSLQQSMQEVIPQEFLAEYNSLLHPSEAQPPQSSIAANSVSLVEERRSTKRSRTRK